MTKLDKLKSMYSDDPKAQIIINFIILPFGVFVALYMFKGMSWLSRKFYGKDLFWKINIGIAACAFVLIVRLISFKTKTIQPWDLM